MLLTMEALVEGVEVTWTQRTISLPHTCTTTVTTNTTTILLLKDAQLLYYYCNTVQVHRSTSVPDESLRAGEDYPFAGYEQTILNTQNGTPVVILHSEQCSECNTTSTTATTTTITIKHAEWYSSRHTTFGAVLRM